MKVISVNGFLIPATAASQFGALRGSLKHIAEHGSIPSHVQMAIIAGIAMLDQIECRTYYVPVPVVHDVEVAS